MNYINLESTVTKKETYEAIDEVLCRFNSLIFELNQHPTVRAGNSLGDLADLMETNNYTASLTELRFNYKLFENLSAKGYVDFLKLCGNLSKKFNLKVSIPEDVKIKDSEDVIEFFITSLTKRALDAISANLLELEVARNTFLEQAEKVDFNDGVVTDLEVILLKRKEYDKAKAVYDEALNQVFMLASSNEIDEALYAPLYQKCNENNALMQDILTNYPMVQFFNGKTQVKTLCKQINKACNDIRDGLLSVQKKIIAGTFPIWELTPLVAELYKEQLFNQNKLIIQDQLNSWKKAEDRKELIITVCSITVSLVGLIIPGGCCLGLLLTKAAFTAAGAVMGTVQGVEDFAKAGLEKDVAYANVKITPEMITLVNNTDVSEATKNYILSGAFLALSLLDIKDTADSVKLIKKLDKLDDVTREALKQSKRFGEKAFQNCDVGALNKIGKELPDTHAIEIFNMKNTTEVVETLHRVNRPKVMINLASLEDASQVPVALTFFPDNLNTNVIWLGMDKVEARSVLELQNSGNAIKHYNNICSNPKTMIHFEDTAKQIENKLNRLFKQTESFSDNERIVLLKETLPPDGKITNRNIYIRVQTNNGYTTLAGKNKEFAWVTDPYLLAGKDMPSDFMYSVGFTNDYMKTCGTDNVYFDVILFKDKTISEKIVPNQITDWKKINEVFLSKIDDQLEWMRKEHPLRYEYFIDTLDVLVDSEGKFNKSLYEYEYLKYFSSEHIPGNDYENGVKSILGELIESCTGASNLYGGCGVTISERGLENVERAFNKFDNFQINQMSNTEKDMKIFRFEVVKDLTVRPGNSVKIENIKIGGN